MLMKVNANTLIDELISVLTDYESCRKEHKNKYPFGQAIYNDTPYNEVRNHICMEKAEGKLQIAMWMFRSLELDKIARTARKWYKKTNWMFCLSSDTAERLVNLYTKTNY
jgi:hypothetical protein